MDAARYVEGYLALEPEEATTLGIRDHDARLKDLSVAASEHAQAFHARALRELGDVADPLDRWTIERISRLALRTAERPNLELSRLPHVVANWQLAQGDEVARIAARLAEAPRFLAEHEGRLRERVEAIDRGLLAQLLGQLPGAVRTCELLGATTAAEAYRRHAEVLRALLVRAGEHWAIGEHEYAWRLEHFFGIERSPAVLIRDAEEEITRARSKAEEVARALGELSTAAAIARVSARRPESAEEVVRVYREALERAGRFARERGLFDVPEDIALDMPETPPGWLPGAYVTNWPAPLRDASGRGAMVLSRDPAVHVSAWAANLAVHEGIPGHHLQSLAWQRRFGAAVSPVRFLRGFDDIAMVHQDFGPMMMIEGWAVWAEEVMLDAGFFQGRPEEELCARVAKSIRHARVLVDVSLHTGRMTPDEAARVFASVTGMPEAFARAQIARYQRVPLQAVTYALGCEGIRRLREEPHCRSMTLLEFHDWLLAHGPVPPPWMGRTLTSAVVEGSSRSSLR